MRARLTFLTLALLAVSAGACQIQGAYTPKALIVPVSYQTHLLTARGCEFRGTVNDPRTADSLGANVVLAFVTNATSQTETRTTEVRGHHGGYAYGAGYGWSYVKLMGKAVLCPEAIVQQLVNMVVITDEATP
jgi:hypothetical protein